MTRRFMSATTSLAQSTDYGILVHGDARGLPNVMVEIRNDLIATKSGAARFSKWEEQE